MCRYCKERPIGSSVLAKATAGVSTRATAASALAAESAAVPYGTQTSQIFIPISTPDPSLVLAHAPEAAPALAPAPAPALAFDDDSGLHPELVTRPHHCSYQSLVSEASPSPGACENPNPSMNSVLSMHPAAPHRRRRYAWDWAHASAGWSGSGGPRAA